MTPKHDVNLLFTSVGRRVELMRAFRRAYAGLDLPGRIVATDIDPLAPALHEVDVPYLVPRFTTPDYIPALVDICQREQITAIFPLIDPDIPLLAQHRTALEATGARLAVVPTAAAAIAADKWLTYRFFVDTGIPTPQSWLPADFDSDAAQYPVFIKPRGGSGAKNTFKVHNARELRFFVDYVPDPIIQEFLPGHEITSDVICDLDGSLLGVISRQRIEVRWGEVAKGVTVHHPAIAEACTTIARAFPALGPITVQCILDASGALKFTEINARLGGGVPLGIAAGADSPRWLLAHLAGLALDAPPPIPYQTGLHLTRYDDSRFLTHDDLKHMERHRL